MDSLKDRVIINESKSKKKNDNNKKYSNMNNNTTTTTKKKKKFLLCFKPMTMDGLEEDLVFKYFAVEEKEGMLFPVISKPSMAPNKKEAQEEEEEEEEKGGGRRKKGRNVKLSKFLKAVFTGPFLAKKLKKRKLGESSFRSETIIAEKGVKTINSVNKDSLKQDDDNPRINSNISSCSRRSSAFTATTMCSSSSSSSSTSNSRSISQRCNSFESTLIGSNSQNEQDNNGSKQRQDKNSNNVQKHEKRSCGFYIGFCLPLICLLVLIFWGKIFAILCTSMGFFMVRWSSRCALPLPKVGIKSSEFDSDERKKKVIMEGLLKRDRAHEL